MDTRWLRCAVLLLGFLCTCQSQEESTTTKSLQTDHGTTTTHRVETSAPIVETTPTTVETSAATDLRENPATTQSSHDDHNDKEDETTSAPLPISVAVTTPTPPGTTNTASTDLRENPTTTPSTYDGHTDKEVETSSTPPVSPVVVTTTPPSGTTTAASTDPQENPTTTLSTHDGHSDEELETTIIPPVSSVIVTMTTPSGTTTTAGMALTDVSEDGTHPTKTSFAEDTLTTASNHAAHVTNAVLEQSTTGAPHESTVTAVETSAATLPPTSFLQGTTPWEATSLPHATSTRTAASDVTVTESAVTSATGAVPGEEGREDNEEATTTTAEETTTPSQDVSSPTTVVATEVPSPPPDTSVPSIPEEAKTTTSAAEASTTAVYLDTTTGSSEGSPAVTGNAEESTESPTMPAHVTTESNDHETTTAKVSDGGREGRGDVAATAMTDHEVTTPSTYTITESSQATTEAAQTEVPSTGTTPLTAGEQSTTTVASLQDEGTLRPTQTAPTPGEYGDVQQTTQGRVDGEQSSTETPTTVTQQSNVTISPTELIPGDAVEASTQGSPDVTTPATSENTIASDEPSPTTAKGDTKSTTEGGRWVEVTTATLPLEQADDNVTTTGTTPSVQSGFIETTTSAAVDRAPSDTEATTSESFKSTALDASTPTVVIGTDLITDTASTPGDADEIMSTANVQDDAATPASEITTSDVTTSAGAAVAVEGFPSDATTTTTGSTEPSLHSTTTHTGQAGTTLVPADLDVQTTDVTTGSGTLVPTALDVQTTDVTTSFSTLYGSTTPQEVPPIVTTEVVADENDTSVNVIVGSRNPKQYSGREETTASVSQAPGVPVESTLTTNALATPEAIPDVTETTESHLATRFHSWFLNYTTSNGGEQTTVSTPEETTTEQDHETPDLLSTLFPELYGISSAAATLFAAHDAEETTTTAEPSPTESAATTTVFSTECDYRRDLTLDCLLEVELNNTVTVEFSTWNDTQAEAFRTVLTQRLSDYCTKLGTPLEKLRVVFIESEPGMDMVSFFVVNKTRGFVVPSHILLPFLNETRPTLEDAVKLSINNAFYGFPPLKKRDEAVARAGMALNLIYIIVAASCATLIVLIVCILTLVKCRSTSHKYSPDSEKLSKDMALKAEIGDLRPGSEILKEEAQMKDTAAIVNGNGTHLTKENEGWVVPYAQVPVEAKNAPDNQDTKL